METQIVPCRAEISDRFPVASFAVNVPPTRFFEVACATDPRLFHTDWQRYRSPKNFYSSRSNGLMRAPDGQTAWFIPPEQLRRFVGAPRIYYALATYESRYGGAPEFTISPQTLDRAPSILVSSDFSGRGLDRSRLGGLASTPDSYGAASAGSLTWGGDEALAASRAASAPQSGEYDDGYPKELWQDEGGDPVAAQAGLGDHAHELGADCRDAEDDYAPAGGMGYENGDPNAYDSSGAGSYSEASASAPDFGEYGDGTGESPEWVGDGYGSVHDDADDGDEDEGEGAYGGYEDAASLYGAVGEIDLEPPLDTGPGEELAYGGGYGPVDRVSDGGGVEVADAPAEAGAYPGAPAEAEALGGRDPGYSEEEPEEDPLPVGRAAQALAVVALDIPEKVRILRVIAVAESGHGGYSAVNPDNEYNDPRHPAYHKYHIGLSWGFIQFTQRSGALGRVLQAIQRREQSLGAALAPEHRFDRLFGPHAQELLHVTTAEDPEARVAPVGGKPLWDREWMDRFRAAGQVPHATFAQNEVAVTDYVDPNLRVALWLGFDNARSLAMLWDRCIHMGSGGGVSWVMRACGPVRTEEDRRAALAALGHADIRSFQQSQAPYLGADGRWGPRTHAALVGALRAIGSRSPVAVPGRDQLLQRLVDEARGSRFAGRLAALHSNRTDFDDATTYVLG